MIEYEDPVDRAEGLLISQYYGSLNLKDYLESIIKVITPTMGANKETQSTRGIDNAYGDSLDKIGKVVGVSRVISGALALGLFGFYSNAVSEGMDIGVFYSYGDELSSDLELNDYQYRNYIRAKILVNTQGGRIEDIIRFIELLLNRSLDIEITETKAAFNVFIHEVLATSDKAILAVAAKEIKPVGVTMTAEDNAGNIVLP